jgi:hypothetical protein
MKRLLLAVSILVLAIAGTSRTASAHPYCPGILEFDDPTYGGCGFTGYLCDHGTGCVYLCNNGYNCWDMSAIQ